MPGTLASETGSYCSVAIFMPGTLASETGSYCRIASETATPD
jgi:hypothetical protein